MQAGSSRPHRLHQAIEDHDLPRLRALIQQGPSSFGKPTSVWKLGLLAQVCLQEELTRSLVSGETIRQAVLRMGESWKRNKHLVSSLDPLYQPKKQRATDC